MTGLLETTTAATPTQAADDATAHALLSCWLREVPGWTLEPAADGPSRPAALGAAGGQTAAAAGGQTAVDAVGGQTAAGAAGGQIAAALGAVTGAGAAGGQTPPGWVGHPPYGRAPTEPAINGAAPGAVTGAATGTVTEPAIHGAAPGTGTATGAAIGARPATGAGTGVGAGGARIVIPLPRWNARLLVGVRRVSATFRHQLELPALLQIAGGEPRPVGLAQLAVLLADALPGAGLRTEPLLTRVLDSAAAVAGHLGERAGEIERLWSAAPLTFAETEQALLLGHLVHPTPKSRGELGAVERRRYSPETGGRFALRWLAADRELVRHGSALDVPAPELAEALLRDDPTVDQAALRAARDAVGGDRILLPAHPYEADRLAADPATADLFDTGAVADLGAWGAPFLPTTSVRTVYRADAAWQLKFSMHVRVTNSMRVTLPKELDRAVESAALARTVVGARTREAAPHFVLVQDPAYLTLARDGEVLNGFSVLLRENRWAGGGPRDVSALTTLCQDHPYGGSSRLVALVTALAARHGRTEDAVAREWFGRFCDVVVRSLVRLYLDVGLCFEAHQQNTLVELEDGWPVRGVYRDSQGYFHREAAHDDLVTVVPGLGEATESIFPEELADERLVYYLFVNLTLGVINALGPCVDETVLLGDLRRVLTEERARGGRYPATLLDRLLDGDLWPCKANLLTRAHDMDELVGDIATQSVYVTLPNPLLAVGS